jgi:hypothetical protein
MRLPVNGGRSVRRAGPSAPSGWGASGHWGPPLGTRTRSVMPLRARLYGLACGAVVCGGLWSHALKNVKQSSGWTSMNYVNIPGGTTTGCPQCWRISFCGGSSCAGGKKAPALTVSPLRLILDVVLPVRTYSVEDVLKVVAWLQRRTHHAYLAPRKRRETEGEIKWRCRSYVEEESTHWPPLLSSFSRHL